MQRHRTTTHLRDLARLPLAAVLVALGLLLAGCASGDDGGTDDAGQTEDTAEDDTADDDSSDDAAEDDMAEDDTADDGAADDEDGEDDAAADGEEAADDGGEPASGEGTATIEFATGDTLSTDVLCVLEPQDDPTGDGQILFTATSLTNPYFDLTTFADADGNQTDTFVSWDETEDFETYQESWSAGGFGSDVEASLDGTTITASGTFTRNEDESGQAGETREAQVTVECG